MGLSKYSYKYLNLGYNYVVISIVTVCITLPEGSMYPNSLYIGPKVPIQGLL